MRILHITETTDGASGVATFVRELDSSLKATGIESHVVCALGKTFSGEALDTDYDIVHIHGLWLPFFHNTSNWAHANGIPIVWSPHGMITPWAMHHKKWKKLLGWRLYQKSDLAKANLIHATAASEVEDVRRMGLSNSVTVVPLGVWVNHLQKQNSTGDKKTLLFVSRVQKKKGLMNLAQAWALLPQTIRDAWKVKIIGPDEDGHTAEIKAKCKQLGIFSEWEFAGPMFGDNLDFSYRQATLFVLPTYSENFGSVVIEALARELPVITTKGAPWQELLERQCGWWIDIGVEPLTKALTEAMSLDDSTLNAMGKRGRDLVEEKYTWPAITKKMIAGYSAISRQ